MVLTAVVLAVVLVVVLAVVLVVLSVIVSVGVLAMVSAIVHGFRGGCVKGCGGGCVGGCVGGVVSAIVLVVVLLGWVLVVASVVVLVAASADALVTPSWSLTPAGPPPSNVPVRFPNPRGRCSTGSSRTSRSSARRPIPRGGTTRARSVPAPQRLRVHSWALFTMPILIVCRND